MNPEGTVGTPDNTKVLDLGFWLLHKKKKSGGLKYQECFEIDIGLVKNFNSVSCLMLS